MGGTISLGPSSRFDRKRKDDKTKKEREQDKERHRRMLERYGVLIPPVFVANKTDDPPLSSRVWERILRESSSAAAQAGLDGHGGSTVASSDLLSWAYRRTRATRDRDDDDDNDKTIEFDAGPLLGQTLLTEYMTPGLFLSLPVAKSGASDGGRFLAALAPPSVSSEQSPLLTELPSLPSFLSLTKRFHRNSSLYFPFPWKVETFLPQHALLSSNSNHTGHLVLPSSMRVTADLSSPASANRTRVAWTTHFLDHDSNVNSNSNSILRPSTDTDIPVSTSSWQRKLQLQEALSPFWTKIKGSWIETELVRPDGWNSGISLRIASAMTLNGLMDNVVGEACRAGKDVYHGYSNSNSSVASGSATPLRKRHSNNSHHPDENIRVRVAAEYKESILASNTNLSLSSLLGRGTSPVVTVTDTLLSLNLNGGGDKDVSETETGHPRPLPPLWLTLKQSKGCCTDSMSPTSSWSLNLSQVVTFDREIWNILEDRAPRVRNHVGWVCQIERFQNHGSGSDTRTLDGNGDGDASSSSSSSTSVLTVGASAQFNRNIAAKAILESKLGSCSSSSSASGSASPSLSTPSAALKFAVVFKRWLEPQASLSIIQNIDLRTGKLSFLGVGLEIEQHNASATATARTRPSSLSQGKDSRVEYRDTADMDPDSSVAPPTRVHVKLPGEKN